MANQNTTLWTDERVQTLKSMWDAGKTGRQIARVLGHGLTRSAVIGKVHRMKLPPRLNPTAASKPPRPHGNKGQPKVNAILAATEARRIKPPTLPETFDDETEVGVDVTNLIGIMDLTERTCRWPHGDPLKPGFGYCGKAKHRDDGPYCPEHTARSLYKGVRQ